MNLLKSEKEGDFGGKLWLGRVVEVYWDSPADKRGFYKGEITKYRAKHGDFEYEVTYEGSGNSLIEKGRKEWESVDNGFRFVNESYSDELRAALAMRKRKGTLKKIKIKEPSDEKEEQLEKKEEKGVEEEKREGTTEKKKKKGGKKEKQKAKKKKTKKSSSSSSSSTSSSSSLSSSSSGDEKEAKVVSKESKSVVTQSPLVGHASRERERRANMNNAYSELRLEVFGSEASKTQLETLQGAAKIIRELKKERRKEKKVNLNLGLD